MIKLIKYDLRRNANLLLAVMTVLILAELVLVFWSSGTLEARMGFAFVFFILAVAIFIRHNLNVFYYNIYSVSRRLLPVNTLSYVWASLVYGLLNNLVLLLVGAGFGLHWLNKFGENFVYKADGKFGNVFLTLSVYGWAELILGFIFSLVFGYLFLYMIIALARGITKKGVFWVGFLLFLILSYAIDWVDNFLFAQRSSQMFNMVNFHFEPTNARFRYDPTTINMSSVGSIVFHILLCIVFLFVIKWCVEKRIEAK
ncbi:hypothetical protein [Paenibacillus sp.]|jgi:hypothetical protein|uniref:hypothetical protein n=1 Tax=Paenibacillus sp. TaxID=58172 RepID=UPI0028221125|nr:hypothetical protein [Paenibacillus sp.]MDR0268211.1 hypothetical protein [Paenibacillus sp.]